MASTLSRRKSGKNKKKTEKLSLAQSEVFSPDKKGLIFCKIQGKHLKFTSCSHCEFHYGHYCMAPYTPEVAYIPSHMRSEEEIYTYLKKLKEKDDKKDAKIISVLEWVLGLSP